MSEAARAWLPSSNERNRYDVSTRPKPGGMGRERRVADAGASILHRSNAWFLGKQTTTMQTGISNSNAVLVLAGHITGEAR